MPPLIVFSDSDSNKIVEMYIEDGLNTVEIGGIFGVGPTAISSHLRRKGIEIRRRGVTDTKLRHSAFSVINDESAYWIGFIAGDGNVYKRNERTSGEISLFSNDIDVIDQLCAFLNTSNRPKFLYKGKKISFCSEQIYIDLVSYGVTPNKSLSLIISDELSENRNFWRGVIEADGSVVVGASSKWWDVGFALYSGNRNFLEQFVKYCADYACVDVGISFNNSKNGHVWQSGVRGEKAIRLAEYFYSDIEGLPAMNRKKQKALELIGRKGNYENRIAL